MFTSGTQARDGRSVNHDPMPWISGRSRYAESYSGGRTVTDYVPRPEFAVEDNPILASFRYMAADRKVPTARRALAFLASVYDMGIAMGLPVEQIDHARRVLAKLAVVYA